MEIKVYVTFEVDESAYSDSDSLIEEVIDQMHVAANLLDGEIVDMEIK